MILLVLCDNVIY